MAAQVPFQRSGPELEQALRLLVAARLGPDASAAEIDGAVAESSVLAREVATLRSLLGPADSPGAFDRLSGAA